MNIEQPTNVPLPDDVKSAVEAANNNVSLLNAESERISKLIRSFNKEIVSLTEQESALKKNIEDLTLQVSSLSIQVSAKEDEKRILDYSIVDLNAQKDTINAEIQDKQTNVDLRLKDVADKEIALQDSISKNEADLCSLTALCEDNTWRYFSAVTGARGTPPVWTQVFAIDLSVPYTSVPKSGCVGEILTATAAPAAVALTTATAATVTSVALTAGDWEVSGVVNYTPAGTTSITILGRGANTTAATLGAQDTYAQFANAATVPGAVVITEMIPNQKFSFSAASTTVYLIARATFTVSTLTAGGTIRARRIR